MKKTFLLMLIIVAVTVTACDGTISTSTTEEVNTTASSRTEEAGTTATSKIDETADTSVSAEESDTTDLNGMPSPFYGETEHLDYFRLCGNNKFEIFRGSFWDKYAEYLGERELISEWWEQEDSLIWRGTNILAYENFYSVAVINDIPIEIVMEAIDECNELVMASIKENEELRGIPPTEESYSMLYTEEDKAALLTQDVERILAHFASEYTIVIGDKAYTPAWLYYSSLEDYEKAGISAEMVLEKVSALSKIDLTDEAVKAFELKLSEFTGGYVSFDR